MSTVIKVPPTNSHPIIERVRVPNPTTEPTKRMPEPARDTPVFVSAQPFTPITRLTPPAMPYPVQKNRQQPLIIFVGLLLIIPSLQQPRFQRALSSIHRLTQVEYQIQARPVTVVVNIGISITHPPLSVRVHQHI